MSQNVIFHKMTENEWAQQGPTNEWANRAQQMNGPNRAQQMNGPNRAQMNPLEWAQQVEWTAAAMLGSGSCANRDVVPRWMGECAACI